MMLTKYVDNMFVLKSQSPQLFGLRLMGAPVIRERDVFPKIRFQTYVRGSYLANGSWLWSHDFAGLLCLVLLKYIMGTYFAV